MPRNFIKEQARSLVSPQPNRILFIFCIDCTDTEIIIVCGRTAICTLIGWDKSSLVSCSLSGFCDFNVTSIVLWPTTSNLLKVVVNERYNFDKIVFGHLLIWELDLRAVTSHGVPSLNYHCKIGSHPPIEYNKLIIVMMMPLYTVGTIFDYTSDQ